MEGSPAVLCAIKWNHCNSLSVLLESPHGLNSVLHHRSSQGENSILVGLRANQHLSLRILLRFLKVLPEGKDHLVRLLKEESAVEKMLPLLCACKWNHTAALHTLLEEPSVLNILMIESHSLDGENPLQVATRHNQGQTI